MTCLRKALAILGRAAVHAGAATAEPPNTMYQNIDRLPEPST